MTYAMQVKDIHTSLSRSSAFSGSITEACDLAARQLARNPFAGYGQMMHNVMHNPLDNRRLTLLSTPRILRLRV